MTMARLALAALLVGAASAGFGPPPRATFTPTLTPPGRGLCMPNEWMGGYTRASDYAAAEGIVTHNYAQEQFALKEVSFGKGYDGKFQFYHLHFFQQVNLSWAGITWADGSTHCYKSNKAAAVVLKQCLDHVGEHVTFNEWPAQTAFNTFENKKSPSHPVIDAMVVTRGRHTYPLQTFSWNFNTTRNPNFFILQNQTDVFDSSIAQIPAECQSRRGEEGPEADAILQMFAQRAAFQSEEGTFAPAQAEVSEAAATTLVADLKRKGAEQSQPSGALKACVPNIYTADFYFMNDNFTSSGKLTHQFSEGVFAAAQNVTGLGLRGHTLRSRFVQKGSDAWVIQESMKGKVTSCSHAAVQPKYDNRCRKAHTRRPIVVNGFPAWHNDLYAYAGSGKGPTYTAFYQAAHSELPIGYLNFTNANVGANGNPVAISFLNVYEKLYQPLLEIPATCSNDEAARAEVLAQADKWANHLLTTF